MSEPGDIEDPYDKVKFVYNGRIIIPKWLADLLPKNATAEHVFDLLQEQIEAKKMRESE